MPPLPIKIPEEVEDPSPMKRGLKVSPIVISSNVTRVVEDPSPMKRGLKVREGEEGGAAGGVEDPSPMKRGLKGKCPAPCLPSLPR